MSIQWNKAPKNPTGKRHWEKYIIYAPRDSHPSNGIFIGYYDDEDELWICGDESHQVKIKPQDVKLICKVDLDEIAAMDKKRTSNS